MTALSQRKMSASLWVVLAALVVVAVGASATSLLPAADRQPEWTTYENPDLGLQFSFPAQWGPVVIASDRGVCANSTGTGSGACREVALAFSGLGTTSDAIFLVVSGADYQGQGDRWIGSLGSELRNEDAVVDLCGRETDPCRVYRTPVGVRVARLETDAARFVEGELPTPRREVLWRLHIPTAGVVIFSDRLQYDAKASNAVAVLDRLVKSVQPVPSD